MHSPQPGIDGITASRLETSRLTARVYVASDLDDIAALYADADVTRYTKLGKRDRIQSRAVLDHYIDTWRAHGFGMRALFLKPAGFYVGECGLFPCGGAVALRYALLKPYWGRGLAGEAVNATVDAALDRLGLERILSIVQMRNIASRRLMEKLGWLKTTTELDGGILLQLYEMTRDQRAARG